MKYISISRYDKIGKNLCKQTTLVCVNFSPVMYKLANICIDMEYLAIDMDKIANQNTDIYFFPSRYVEIGII